MGNTIRMLLEKKLRPESDIYGDFFSVERCESFHLHWRNLRMMFDRKEFEEFCGAVREAHSKWWLKNRKNPNLKMSKPEYLFIGKINPVHGERSRDFAIEVQGNLPHMPRDMIHIHYKSLRLDVSHREFVELADAFARALREFKKWKGETK